jgi:diaminopimelate decarboxylase
MTENGHEGFDGTAVARSGGMLAHRSRLLHIEDVAVNDVVTCYGSPLFVISETTLRRQARRIRDAFRNAWRHGEVVVMPAVKANPVLALQRVLAQEGFGADLVGAGELEVAIRAGIAPGRISLNGTGKDQATIERAVALGVPITIDDVREIELAGAAAARLGRRAELRLRLRPYVDISARMEATGVPIVDVYGTYKSGIPDDDLAEAGRALSSAPELVVRGVMMHMGRYTTDLEVIGQFSRRFGEMICELARRWDGWTPRAIDIGGGFAPEVDSFGRGLPHFADPPIPPPIEAYATAICDQLSQALAVGGVSAPGCVLEVEPGRALFGPAGIHVTTLLNVKRQTRPFPFTWYETDTTVSFLSDLPVSSGRAPVVPVRLPDPAGPLGPARVVGRSCMSDVLARQAQLPAMRRGDLLAFAFTGAYHESGASNFNVLPRPATVLVHESQAHLVRRAETVDDVLARDTVPDHLRPAFEGAAR